MGTHVAFKFHAFSGVLLGACDRVVHPCAVYSFWMSTQQLTAGQAKNDA